MTPPIISDREALANAVTIIGEAIENLRAGVDPDIVGNDLALLHLHLLAVTGTERPLLRVVGGTMTGDDARIRFSRADKRERIEDEVWRGEHRDDD